MRKVTTFILLAVVMLMTTAIASADNMLVNPDFETGDLTGWTPFGNASVTMETGGNAAKLFGNFDGNFNVTGIFQSFPASAGDTFIMDADSFHLSNDPMIGGGPPDSNWVVMKMAFFSGGSEIGGAEATILDGTFATDVWHDNAPVMGTAPAGTDEVQALILYLQPAFDGGAAHIDNVFFEQQDATAVELGSVASQSESLSLMTPLVAVILLALVASTVKVYASRPN